MIILNDGCSHSAGTIKNRSSYCDFLPGQIHNIAVPASGINKYHLEHFLDHDNKDIQLTHFIFQIQSPSRQTVYLNLEDKVFLNAPIDYWDSSKSNKLKVWVHEEQNKDIIKVHSIKRGSMRFMNRIKQSSLSLDFWDELYTIDPEEFNKMIEQDSPRLVYDNFLWAGFKRRCRVPTTVWTYLRAHDRKKVDEFIIELFEAQDRYFRKAIREIDNTVSLIRKQWPNIKIIFLRYEETGMPLIYEFSRLFFKKDVADYCNKNDITYIYEKDFNTEWFRSNHLTHDGRHPNAEGAKLIAERIKQVL